nr:hypothetical protein [Tanacetum cinerariifolium]
NKQFYRHVKEDPHAHIRYFNKITSTLKFPNVPNTSNKLRLFPFSLEGQNQSPALVKEVEESCVTCSGAHSYINCPAIDGNVYRDNIQEFMSQASAVNYNQGNTSYRPQMMSNQIRPPGFPPVPNNQNVQKNNQNRFIPNQNRGQNMQNQLTNLTGLIMKFVNSNSASTSIYGTLPNNTIANPKSDKQSLLEVAVQFESLILTEPKIAPVSAPKPNPKALIPCPSRRNDESNREKANNQIEKFYQIFKDMSFEISFADALILMPKFASTLKALIGNKEKLSEMARTSFNEHCSAALLKKLPAKLGDPGKFLIPCDFPGMAECLTLAPQTQGVSKEDFSAYVKASDAVMRNMQTQVSAPRPNLRPLIPYTSRLQDQKLHDKANDQREKFFQIFKDLNFNISFSDDLILMPKFGPSIKSLLTNNEQCSTVLLKKLPEKLGDPDKF